MLAWHVATVKPCSEALAELHLKRQGFDPFNPQYRTRKIVRGETITRTRPLLPGYIFIKFDSDVSRWRSINGTHGVKRLFTTDAEKPLRIPVADMQLIIDQCDEDGFVKKFELDQALAQRLAVGDMVKVREGLFKDFVAPVHWTDGQRVKIVMMIFGRDKAVEFSKGQLERVA